MPSNYLSSSVLHAPISALARASDPDARSCFFAQGNEIWWANEDIHFSARCIARRANTNAVLISLLDMGNGVLLAGDSHGTVYCTRYSHHTTGSIEHGEATEMRPSYCFDDRCRVLAFGATRTGDSFGVVVVGSNGAVVQLTGLSPNQLCHVNLLSLSVAPQGVVLAADVAAIADNDVSIFTASYSGRVLEWRRSVGAVVSHMSAHQPGCATFAVRCIVSAAHMFLATCADDRTATVFYRSTASKTVDSEDLSPTWALLWRGGEGVGASLGHGRLFDVDLTLQRHTTETPALSLAVASEEGSVRVLDLCLHRGTRDASANSAYLGVTASNKLSREHLHCGNGVTKVAFAAVVDDARGAMVFSGGFDGAVLALTCPSANEHGCGGRYTLDVINSAETSSSASLRCVAVGAAGALAFSTDVAVGFSPSSSFTDCPHIVRVDALLAPKELPCRIAFCVLPPSAACRSRNCAAVAIATGLTSGNILLTVMCFNAERARGAEAASEDCASPVIIPIGRDGSAKKCMALHVTCSENTSNIILRVVSLHVCGNLVQSVLCLSSQTYTVVSQYSTVLYSNLSVATHTVFSVMDDVQFRGCSAFAVVGYRDGGMQCCRLPLSEPSLDAATVSKLKNASTPPLLYHSAARVALADIFLTRDSTEEEGRGDDVSPRASLTVTYANGSYCVVGLDRVFQSSSPPYSSCLAHDDLASASINAPVRFPFECSGVVCASSTVLLDRYGSTLRCYRRLPIGSRTGEAVSHAWWRLTDEVPNVKAPRLRAAFANTDGAAFCHCGDGRHVEVTFWSTQASPSTTDSSDTLTHGAAAAVQVVHESAMSGKDYNCCVHVAALDGFVYGAEDSTLLIHPINRAGANKRQQTVLRGPHQSNILAMCVLPACSGHHTEDDGITRIVTVGGFATVVVWECCTATAATPLACTPLPSASNGHWSVAAAFVNGEVSVTKMTGKGTKAPSTGDPLAAEDPAVVRFMSVAAADALNVHVAASDGTVWLFALRSTHDEVGPDDATAAAAQMSMRRLRLVSRYALHEMRSPRPLLSITFDVSSRLGVVADSRGRLVLYRMESCSNARLTTPTAGTSPKIQALTSIVVENSAVNGLSSFRETTLLHCSSAVTDTTTPEGCYGEERREYLLFACCDSGNVVLVKVSHSSCESSLTCLASVSIGFTACRGGNWFPHCEIPWMASVVNDEAVAIFRVYRDDKSNHQKDGDVAWRLELTQRTAHQIRCISGVAIGDDNRIAVAGQGIQEFRVSN